MERRVCFCARSLAVVTSTLLTMLAGNVASAAEIHEAAKDGDTARMQAILAKGVPIDAHDEDGQTALFLAAGHGNTDVVRLLLEKGAKVDAKQKDGFTPLDTASWKGRTEIVKLLVKAGADVNSRDKMGGSALWFAA